MFSLWFYVVALELSMVILLLYSWHLLTTAAEQGWGVDLGDRVLEEKNQMETPEISTFPKSQLYRGY